MTAAAASTLERALADGIRAVQSSTAAGYLSAAEADLLLRHLVALWATRRINDLVTETLSPERLFTPLTPRSVRSGRAPWRMRLGASRAR